MATQIQIRRDTATDWSNENPTLASGEIGFETDTRYFKIGDGSTAWDSLDYSGRFDSDGNLDMGDGNIDDISSIDGGGDAVNVNDNLDVQGNSLDNVSSAGIEQQIARKSFTKWRRYQHNPTFEPTYSTSDWDGIAISTPEIFVPQHISAGDREVWMLYDGTDARGGGGGGFQTGLAKSIYGGENWTRYTGNPVLAFGGGGTWDEDEVADAHLLWDGSQYVMGYIGDPGQAIGVATSPDAESWTKIAGNPVIDANMFVDGMVYDSSYSRPYRMYVGGGGVDNKLHLYSASGDDLSSWQDEGIILEPTEPWENGDIWEGSVSKYNGKYYILYGDNDSNYIGLATSEDGTNWTKYSGNPIQSSISITSWERNRIQNAHFTQLENGNRIMMYGTVPIAGQKFGLMKEDQYDLVPQQYVAKEQDIPQKYGEVYLSSSQTDVVSGVDETVLFDSIRHDYVNAYDPSTGEYTVSSAHSGLYLIQALVLWSNSDVLDQTAFNIQIYNASEDSAITTKFKHSAVNGEYFSLSTVGIAWLTMNQKIKITVKQLSGDTMTIYGSGSGNHTKLSIFKLLH